MSEITEPFLYRLISYELEKGTIFNGLTIPYIVGAKSLLDKNYEVSKESISLLLNEIVNSSMRKIPFLMFCSELQEFVVSLMSKNEAEKISENRISFYNPVTGEKTFFISLNAENRGLGNTIEKIGENLNDRYSDILKISKFSRQGNNGWRNFDKNEITRITAL